MVAATSAAVAVLVGVVIIRLLAVCCDCDDDDARAERSATIDDANDWRSVHPMDADEYDEVNVIRW